MKIRPLLTSFFDNVKAEMSKTLILWLFYLTYIFAMIYLSSKMVIWQDESSSLFTASHPLIKIINFSYIFEGQPPAYFTMLALWLKINNGVLFARLLSIIFILLSAFYLDKIGKLIFKDLYSRWIVILFLLNPYTVWASLEIRLYSFLILLCLLTICLFYLIYYHGRHRLKFVYLIIGIVGVYTQYYYALLIIALSILLLISKGWRPFFNFCIWSALIAIIFSPNLLFIKNQFIRHQDILVTSTLHEWIGRICYSPAHFIFDTNTLEWGMFGRWIGQGMFFLFSILIIYKAIRLYKDHNHQDSKTLLELFIPVSILLIFFLILFSVTNIVYSLRYLSIIYPFYFLLLSSIGMFGKKSATTIYGVFAVYYFILLVLIYQTTYLKTYNGKMAAKYISGMEGPNEPILFRDQILEIAVSPYYKGPNKIYSIREFDYMDKPIQRRIKDTVEFKQAMDKYTKNCKSLIFVNGADSGYVIYNELLNPAMDSCIQHHFVSTKDTTMEGKGADDYIRIRRLFKK